MNQPKDKRIEPVKPVDVCPICGSRDVHYYNKIQIFSAGWACRVCAYCGFFGEAHRVSVAFDYDDIQWSRRPIQESGGEQRKETFPHSKHIKLKNGLLVVEENFGNKNLNPEASHSTHSIDELTNEFIEEANRLRIEQARNLNEIQELKAKFQRYVEALEFLFKGGYELMYYLPTNEYFLQERERYCPMKTISDGKSPLETIIKAMESLSVEKEEKKA